MATRPDIHLYTTQTPNGIKISITLEELGIPYKVTKIDITKDQQKEPWFLEINPNGRIPALTDTFSDGKQIRLFESGSIQQYLVDEYDTEHKISYPKGSREYYEVNNWLFFLNAGVGPMQGQANHFTRYAPEHIQYGVNRYQNESRRLYGVLNEHLKKSTSGYLVGDKCTIADIAHWGWIVSSVLLPSLAYLLIGIRLPPAGLESTSRTTPTCRLGKIRWLRDRASRRARMCPTPTK
jgi:glutathione S-transferase